MNQGLTIVPPPVVGEALRRLEAQPPEEFYASRADWVVENGPQSQPEPAVRALLEELREERESARL